MPPGFRRVLPKHNVLFQSAEVDSRFSSTAPEIGNIFEAGLGRCAVDDSQTWSAPHRRSGSRIVCHGDVEAAGVAGVLADHEVEPAHRIIASNGAR